MPHSKGDIFAEGGVVVLGVLSELEFAQRWYAPDAPMSSDEAEGTALLAGWGNPLRLSETGRRRLGGFLLENQRRWQRDATYHLRGEVYANMSEDELRMRQGMEPEGREAVVIVYTDMARRVLRYTRAMDAAMLQNRVGNDLRYLPTWYTRHQQQARKERKSAFSSFFGPGSAASNHPIDLADRDLLFYGSEVLTHPKPYMRLDVSWMPGAIAGSPTWRRDPDPNVRLYRYPVYKAGEK